MKRETIKYPEALFRLYRRHRVFPVWYLEHEGLFHKRWLRSKQIPKYGFGEFFTAIHFRNRGYRVLVGGYRNENIDRKRYRIALRLLGRRAAKFILRPKGTHPPDLLVYGKRQRPFFVEVKMPWDRLSEKQKAFFVAMERDFPWRIRIVHLKPRRNLLASAIT